VLTAQALEPLGWPEAAAAPVLRSLGYVPARRKAEAGAPAVWRRRSEAKPPPPMVRPDSPFAALVALAAPSAPARRKRRRARKPRASTGSA
jgi:hypothetical protein